MSAARSLLCPSAQPGMTGLRLIGVIEATPDGSRVAYLNEDVPVTPELLSQTGDVPPSLVFRLGGHCEEHRCTHFDGQHCRLVNRIVDVLPEVVDALPICLVRSTCRWYAEQGGKACRRCPQVVTELEDPSEEFRRAALPQP